jgi:protein phosphatase
MQFKVGSLTDIGRKRSQNQDNMLALPELGLFIVADGMGGHRGGETASAMVTEIVPEIVRQGQSQKDWNPRTVITEAILSANRAIFERAFKQQQLQGMGTTTTALLFKGDKLVVGHVGDSRCYFFHPGAVWQITRDHSLVQEKLRAGLINRTEAKMDRMRNVITRSVGFEPDLSVEVYEMTVKPSDVFLICSDGLSGLIEDSKMLEVVGKTLFEEHDIKKTVEKLVEAANTNGGDDNITAIMVEVTKIDG